MGAVVPMNSKVPAALRDFNTDENDALSSGLSGGFGVLSIKGGKFRIKYGGEEIPVTDDDDVAVGSLEVILLKASPDVAKTFYEGAYDGSNDEPDCFSMDGIKPSSRAPVPQSKLCKICPQNKFGSKVSRGGKDAKACTDSRRVAIVPSGDIENEQYGGPMLLRVPTMSLGDLGTYGRLMKAKGFPYNTVVTRISFDPETEYPKLMFKAVRPVSDEEAAEILEHLHGEKVDTVLFEAREITQKTADETELEDEAPKKPKAKAKPKAVDTDFEEEAPAPAAEKPKPKKPKPSAKPKDEEPAEEEAAAPATEQASDDLDAELDDIFAQLD